MFNVCVSECVKKKKKSGEIELWYIKELHYGIKSAILKSSLRRYCWLVSLFALSQNFQIHREYIDDEEFARFVVEN